MHAGCGARGFAPVRPSKAAHIRGITERDKHAPAFRAAPAARRASWPPGAGARRPAPPTTQPHAARLRRRREESEGRHLRRRPVGRHLRQGAERGHRRRGPRRLRGRHDAAQPVRARHCQRLKDAPGVGRAVHVCLPGCVGGPVGAPRRRRARGEGGLAQLRSFTDPRRRSTSCWPWPTTSRRSARRMSAARPHSLDGTIVLADVLERAPADQRETMDTQLQPLIDSGVESLPSDAYLDDVTAPPDGRDRDAAASVAAPGPAEVPRLRREWRSRPPSASRWTSRSRRPTSSPTAWTACRARRERRPRRPEADARYRPTKAASPRTSRIDRSRRRTPDHCLAT